MLLRNVKRIVAQRQGNDSFATIAVGYTTVLSSSDSAKSPEGLLIGKEQFLDMTGSHVFFGTIGRPRIERLELDFDLSDQLQVERLCSLNHTWKSAALNFWNRQNNGFLSGYGPVRVQTNCPIWST